MDILYMGYYCNEDLFNELVEKGSKSSHARQQFERKLLQGLVDNIETHTMHMISYLPFVDSNMTMKKGETYKGCDIQYVWSSKKPIGILKAILTNMKNISQWGKTAGNHKVVVTYSANPLHCIPAMILRKKYGYKIVTISSEISIYRKWNSKSIMTWIHEKVSYYLENNFDGYVLLSKYMNEVINLKKKPYIVVEGFAEPDEYTWEAIPLEKRKNAILYAGGLNVDNGIKILVEGFRMLPKDFQYELWICGDGELKEYVEQMAAEDNRIKFMGILPNKEVQKLERQVKFLINPRFSSEEFTKYSFPSKTLEYMSTGTPTILTRLKGIPEEYFRYCIVLEDESVYGIENLFERLNKIDRIDYEFLGKNAGQFVRKKKNPYYQSVKIIEFLAKL